MVSFAEVPEMCVWTLQIVALGGITLFVFGLSVGICIILPCWGHSNAGFFKSWKIPARPIFIFIFFFTILPFTVLSRLDRLYDWDAFPLNATFTIMSLAIYAKVHPEIFEQLESFLDRHEWHPLLAVTSTAAKLSTSKKDMQKEKEFISEMRRLKTEEVRLAQYRSTWSRMPQTRGMTAPDGESAAGKSTKEQMPIERRCAIGSKSMSNGDSSGRHGLMAPGYEKN